MNKPDSYNGSAKHRPFKLYGATVVPTCGACPEQYDVDMNGQRIGYLKLRWGHFHAAYPDVGGEIVYEHFVEDGLSGCFLPEERKVHLPAAVKALVERHEQKKDPRSNFDTRETPNEIE